jgi:undecaprenyl-diphosphatase
MDVLEALIMAIVEGLTEFLPISSTGHMIIVSSLFGIEETEVAKVFNVNIQFGAILSVVVLYWKRFFQTLDFYYKLVVAFIPAAVLGFILDDYIDALLGDVRVVAIMLLLGGIVLVFIDKWVKNIEDDGNELPEYKNAFIIGFFQALAMVPGVSRSAATIIGGQLNGLSRKSAAEFSFFLAVPTMFAASSYKMLKNYDKIQSDQILVILFGNVVAFLVAMLAIKFFISFLTKHGFRLFGYYRIALGLLILGLLAAGVDLKLND